MINSIGGVFIRANDVDKLKSWYKDILELDIQSWGGLSFTPKPKEKKDAIQSFCLFDQDNDYFDISSKYMINFKVENFDNFIQSIKDKGVEVYGTKKDEFGKFAWIFDIEGNKIELWQP